MKAHPDRMGLRVLDIVEFSPMACDSFQLIRIYRLSFS
jgi:hypothetical protein